jgi:hypothetical protein
MIFHIPRTPKYENVHRPENTGRSERYSIAATLLPRKFVLKKLLYKSAYVAKITAYFEGSWELLCYFKV